MDLRLASFPLLGLLLAVPTAQANVVGNDTQNFNPVSGASDFVTVQSAATLSPGRYNLGLFVNDATNTLPYRSATQDRTHVTDSLVGMDLGIGIGLLPQVELGVALPFVAQQTVNDDATRGDFAQTGNTAVRLEVKWAFLRAHAVGLAAIASANIDRVQDDPHTGAPNAAIYNGELAGDAHAGRFTLGMNVGYRVHQNGERLDGSLIAPVGTEALGSLAASYRLTSATSLVAETYGAHPLQGIANETDRSTSSAEALVGLRYAFTPALLGHAGIGTGLFHGLSTPDWRVYAGIVSEFGGGGSSGHTVTHADKPKSHPKAAPPAEPTEPGQPDSNAAALALVPTEEPSEVFVLHNINFEFDSDYRVLGGALTELNKLSAHLAKHPYDKIVVEGHCDYLGTDDYNDDLSQRRARAVRRQLIKHNGFDPEKIIAVGFGKRVPMTGDPSDVGRQLNRRVEIKIYRSDVAH